MPVADGEKKCAYHLRDEADIKKEEIVRSVPRPIPAFSGPIATSRDMGNFMSQLMVDLRAGTVEPVDAQAMCQAAGVFLKVVEMEMRYRKMSPFLKDDKDKP